MAITYVAGSAVSAQAEPASTTIAATLGAAVAVGDVIVGMAGWDGTANNISGVADDLGNSYTLHADKIDDTTGNQSGRSWRSKITVAGTPVITVTFTTSVSSRRMIAVAWRGADAAPFDASVGNWQTSPGTGTDAVTSTALTPGQNDSLLIGFHQNSAEVDPGTGTLTVGTNYTNRLTTNAILMVEDRILAVAASVAATLTISNDHRSITHLVVIKPASQGGAPPGGGLVIGSATSFIGAAFVGAAEAVGGITAVDGVASGVSTVASVAAAIWNGVTAAAGVAASTVLGAALWLSVAAAPGVATGAATGATVLEGVGAAAGVAASSVVGASVFATVVSSVGVATADAEGADGASGAQGVASGTAIAAAVGAATAGSPGSAAGTSTVLASAATVIPTGGASGGAAAASGVGARVLASVGSVSGTAQASAVSGATAGSEASASCVATVAGVADAPPAVESGSGGRARFRPSRQLSRVTLQLAIPSPIVLVRGWTVAPPHATLSVRWSSPIVEVFGGSVSAYHVTIDAALIVHLSIKIDARTEPPTFDMTDEELLFLAARWLDG